MTSRATARAALALVLAAGASTAHADPCHAIPDRGPLPVYLARGKVFAGPVVYVGDGDSLCVDLKAKPGGRSADWVEVRLADFFAPELAAPDGAQAKAALTKIAKGRRVECVAGRRSYDRVIAICRLRGVSLGDRMRAAGVAEGGRGR